MVPWFNVDPWGVVSRRAPDSQRLRLRVETVNRTGCLALCQLRVHHYVHLTAMTSRECCGDWKKRGQAIDNRQHQSLLGESSEPGESGELCHGIKIILNPQNVIDLHLVWTGINVQIGTSHGH